MKFTFATAEISLKVTDGHGSRRVSRMGFPRAKFRGSGARQAVKSISVKQRCDFRREPAENATRGAGSAGTTLFVLNSHTTNTRRRGAKLHDAPNELFGLEAVVLGRSSSIAPRRSRIRSSCSSVALSFRVREHLQLFGFFRAHYDLHNKAWV